MGSVTESLGYNFILSIYKHLFALTYMSTMSATNNSSNSRNKRTITISSTINIISNKLNTCKSFSYSIIKLFIKNTSIVSRLKSISSTTTTISSMITRCISRNAIRTTSIGSSCSSTKKSTKKSFSIITTSCIIMTFETISRLPITAFSTL